MALYTYIGTDIRRTQFFLSSKCIKFNEADFRNFSRSKISGYTVVKYFEQASYTDSLRRNWDFFQGAFSPLGFAPLGVLF